MKLLDPLELLPRCMAEAFQVEEKKLSSRIDRLKRENIVLIVVLI